MVVVALFASLALILFLVSKKVNVGYSLIMGAILLALLNGKSIYYILKTLLKTLLEYTTVSITLTILFIGILGHIMDKYYILDRMIITLEKLLGSAKFTILISPAIIGTLLVTGGALISCPIVDKLGDRLNIPNDKKAAINLIFRHALYFIFPMAPAMILAIELGNFNMWDLSKLQLPIALVMYFLGYFFYLRKCKSPAIQKTNAKEYLQTICLFILYASPIIISLLVVIIFNFPFYISLIFGILSCILIHLYDTKQDKKHSVKENLFQALYEGIKPDMAITIIGIMIFKNIVENINEIYVLISSLLHKGIPIELLILLACFMLSFPIASIQPSIAVLFPIILPLAPNNDIKLLYAMFIYTTGFVFYYISPVHLCQVLTLEYFEVEIKDLYKNYIYILPLIFFIMLILYLTALPKNLWPL